MICSVDAPNSSLATVHRNPVYHTGNMARSRPRRRGRRIGRLGIGETEQFILQVAASGFASYLGARHGVNTAIAQSTSAATSTSPPTLLTPTQLALQSALLATGSKVPGQITAPPKPPVKKTSIAPLVVGGGLLALIALR